MRTLLLLLTLGLAAVVLVPTGVVFADEGDIEVLEVGAESQFPDSVKFQSPLKARRKSTKYVCFSGKWDRPD